jgi:hypothetical protein
VKQVFLFDIDGTLINTSGAGGAALNLALLDAFGITQPKKISLSGRTDRGIALEFFEHHQIEPSESNWRRFKDAYLPRLRDTLSLRQGIVLPGVRELLARISAASQTALGLLVETMSPAPRSKPSTRNSANERIANSGSSATRLSTFVAPGPSAPRSSPSRRAHSHSTNSKASRPTWPSKLWRTPPHGSSH